MTKLATGASAEVYGWGAGYVIKLFYRGFPEDAITRELNNARIAHDLGIPTRSSRLEV